MITTTVRFALMLYDDFSGKPIRGQGCLFTIDGTPARPLIKPEGYYVFLGNNRSAAALTVRCLGYEETAVDVCPASSSHDPPIVALRLRRDSGRWYPDCLALTGTLPKPQAPVRTSRPLQPPILLLKSAKKGDVELSLTVYTRRSPLRLNLCVGDDKKREPIVLVEQLSDTRFALEQPLQNHHKEGEQVDRLYLGASDAYGRFTLLVEDDGKPPDTVEYYDREVDRWVSFAVQEHS